MQIVINTRFLTQPITGVQRFAIEISKILKKEYGSRILFVSPEGVLDKRLGSELEVKIIGKNSSHIWEQVDLPRFLKQNKSPLLINFCNTAPLFYKNKIVTIHDVGFETFPQTYSKSFLYFYKFLIPRIARNSKAIITVSEFSKQELIKFYRIDAENINVIYNAVGNVFKQISNEKLRNENYFLAVSSLNYRKNLTLVLESFLEFSKTNPSYKLYLVGDLDDKVFASLDLRSYEKLENITFTGRISDQELAEYYSNAITFIYPSFYEGFGIPPLEAQKCRTPSIISEESCFQEIFGDSAIYCNAYDKNDLVAKMELVISKKELREEIIRNGVINEEKYSWKKSADKLIPIINQYYR